MSDYDLIVRNGHVVTDLGVQQGDIAVQEGIIAAVGNNIGGSSATRD